MILWTIWLWRDQDVMACLRAQRKGLVNQAKLEYPHDHVANHLKSDLK